MSLRRKIHLGERERVVAVVRRYAITRWWLYALGGLFLAVTAFFTFWLFSRGPWGYGGFGLGLSAGIYILFRTHFFERANYLVITSERLVAVKRPGWFRETVASLGYLDMKEILVERRGPFAGLLNYGTIVATARDGQAAIALERVHAPLRLQSKILEVKEMFKVRRRGESSAALFHGFLERLSGYSEEELRRAGEKIAAELVQRELRR